MGRFVRTIGMNWLLVASLAVLAFGPGLHVLPGFDHGCHDSRNECDILSSPHDDCPICQFFTQGQLPAERFDRNAPEFVQPQPNALAIAPPLAERHGVPSLRGPPLIA